MDSKEQKSAGRRKPPGGSRKGIPNKATQNAREAIARLVDGNAWRMEEWLQRIEQEEGPLAAWKCMQDVIEYHIPKLSRTEHTGKDGKDLTVTLQSSDGGLV